MTRRMFGMFWGIFVLAIAQPAIATDSILLNFTSSQCGPCRSMQPVLAELERSGTPIRHVDVQSEPELVSRYRVQETPTFVVVQEGREIARLVGTQSIGRLRSALATDPSGPLTPTAARNQAIDELTPPQTRLAPLSGGLSSPSRSPGRDGLAGEAMPSMSVADAVERARAATVRLRVHDGHGYGAGTGTIIDTHGDEALVLTCGHLFRDTEGKGRVEVDLFVGGQTRTVDGEVIDYDADTRDIALVAIRPGFAVKPVAVIGPSQRVSTGSSAFSFGCDRGDDPSRRDTRISGIDKYNQHLGVSNLEIQGAPIDGRSGGGLFDVEGRLIGVCNAADYQDDVGIYAGPGNIHWQLDRVGMSQVYQGQPAIATPPQERFASLQEPLSAVGQPGVGPTGVEPITQPATIPAAGRGAVGPSSLEPITQPAPLPSRAGSAGFADTEVIVIVRDKSGNRTADQVITFEQPSDELMQLIQRTTSGNR